MQMISIFIASIFIAICFLIFLSGFYIAFMFVNGLCVGEYPSFVSTYSGAYIAFFSLLFSAFFFFIGYGIHPMPLVLKLYIILSFVATLVIAVRLAMCAS
jgi:hypothetical protein